MPTALAKKPTKSPSSTGRSLRIKDLDDEPKTKAKKKKTAPKKPAAKKPKVKKVVKKKTVKQSTKAAPKKTDKKAKTAVRKVAKKTPKKPAVKTKKLQVNKPRVKATKSKAKKPKAATKPKVKVVTKNDTKPHPAAGKSKKNPLGHLLVEKLIIEAGFTGGISTNKDVLKKYSTDESIFSIKPQMVLQPRSQRDVEIAVRVIHENTEQFPSLSLTPRAAGTGLSGGSLSDSIIIDVMKYLDHIDDPVIDNGEVTIACEPGAAWSAVEKILKKEGAYLPPYPASKDICTIGGSVANNAAGPNSLRHGHCADWVQSMQVTLYDGHTYELKPITYKEYKNLIKHDNAHSNIAREIFTLIEKNEKAIQEAKPKTRKNSSGYAIWDVLSGSVASFKRGKATLDLTKLISGSQGTIGVITSVTMRSTPIETKTKLVVVPTFNAAETGKVIETVLKYDPLNIELFDGLTYDLALRNPGFFRSRLSKSQYCRVLLSMYTMYHVRFVRQIPEFMLLITFDENNLKNRKIESIVKALRTDYSKGAREVTNAAEQEMLWQVRRASYTLSKFQDTKKRPAAFLEDMTVPPENFSKFFVEIKKLLKKFNVRAAIHGHGGNGHLHFYPLLDFTEKNTPNLIEKMCDEFFATAIKHGGNICGEHNDGIIRTPHLSKMYNKKILTLFELVEHIFDPQDIFNPGKKVNPKFDVKESIRHTN